MNLSGTPALFGRFHVVWTPTVLVMGKGEERSRIEGYLPREEFLAELKMGLARVQVMSKRWQEAERWFAEIADAHDTAAAPAAMYWRAVCQYSASHDASPLKQVAQTLREQYPYSIWTVRASVWLPPEQDQIRKAGA